MDGKGCREDLAHFFFDSVWLIFPTTKAFLLLLFLLTFILLAVVPCMSSYFCAVFLCAITSQCRKSGSSMRELRR